ncbi:dephospho-CoA kinase [Silvibacterium dinghuense]|uniref:Dephospho-CoA kinase n=1 Tax=Silvibacterium dinghuense TaxID=1560006 RepID=A0A4Q1SJQ4_9BACT|nr:dephospho-CoA kinase [Silvibacterium dinghuense]RXS97894.1 dephospho-CoA kinase [Silvibacterium dinghuense]GGH02811.1 dephospho-CoA kinase [Silvibacterium dinghuense]
MLRVGLTGGLGSGKTTVSQILRELGAQVLEADLVGRQMMEPGHAVYDAVVRQFGPEVVRGDGTLDRKRLAELAFAGNRLAELTKIVHPPVIAAEERWCRRVAEQDPSAVAVVESALIFESVKQGTVPGWRQRFDRVILVTAPETLRIQRYVERIQLQGTRLSLAELEADARGRIAAQMPDSEKIPLADYVIHNDSSLESTRRQTQHIYAELKAAARV